MDEENFEQTRRAAGVDAVGEKHLPHPVLVEAVPVSALRRGGTSDARTSVITPADHAARPGIVWVRASDLLSTGTGRIAGRGVDFEVELTRRMRRTPPPPVERYANAPTGFHLSASLDSRESIPSSHGMGSDGADP
jgi:hypothetical protein